MRKQWMAMLSVLGLTAPAVHSQVAQGTTNENSQTTNNGKVKNSEIVSPRDPQLKGKLKVQQQTLRQQNGGGRQGEPLSTNCQTGNKANNNQLTPPPPGGNNQLTKGKVQAVGQTGAGTKVQGANTSLKANPSGGGANPSGGRQAGLTQANVVKGTDVAGGGGGGTKNSQALKGNAVRGTDVAGGNGGGTKNSQALKGNAVRGTDVAGGNGGGTKNSQALKGNNQLTKPNNQMTTATGNQVNNTPVPK
ncbi:MAG TPA: hypothetical protein VKE98_18295 [Gemmataceae bacterium]|nr:hypothetical protein [Gemmataceae bacterium]